MAKGTDSKAIIFKKMLELFDGAFSPDGKEIRIPMMEGGEEVQIKFSLVAAKDNIAHAGTSTEAPTSTPTASAFPPPVKKIEKPTEEEKQRVADLVSKLF